MAAPIFPLLALGGLIFLATREATAAPPAPTPTPAVPPPPPPPPATPGAPQPLPAGIPPAPQPPAVVMTVSPPEELPCHYHMLRRFPGLPDEEYRVITVPPQPFSMQTIYEAVLRTWFQSVPLFPGQWTLMRNCDLFSWVVIDTRNVLMVV